MFQIDGPDAVNAKPEKKPPETGPGWFDGGDPIHGNKASMVTRDWLNTVQAELKNVIEGADIALDRTDDSQLLQAIRALVKVVINTDPDVSVSSFPIGGIVPFYGTTAPEGFLPCDGSAFSATDYPKLYAQLGKATTPDLRGMFIRGTGGAAAGLGVVQQDAGRNVTGRWAEVTGGPVLTNGCVYMLRNTSHSHVRASTSTDSYVYYIDASRIWGAAHTASEFRPVNVALLYCIKHD
jgi:hypothetical protein